MLILLGLAVSSGGVPLLVPAGCAAAPVKVTTSRRIAAARDVIWLDLDVPDVRGAPGCGAQALAAVLAFHDRELVASDVAEALPWHAIEASADELIATARDNGREAAVLPPLLDDVIDELRSGRPVIVRLDERDLTDRQAANAQTPTLRGWAVVGGWRDGDRAVLLARSGGRVLHLETAEFERRWMAAGRSAVRVFDGPAPRGGPDG